MKKGQKKEEQKKEGKSTAIYVPCFSPSEGKAMVRKVEETDPEYQAFLKHEFYFRTGQACKQYIEVSMELMAKLKMLENVALLVFKISGAAAACEQPKETARRSNTKKDPAAKPKEQARPQPKSEKKCASPKKKSVKKE